MSAGRQATSLLLQTLCAGYQARSQAGCHEEGCGSRDERPHSCPSRVDGALRTLAGKKFSAKITSVLKLFRVQDARAALPQNCSPKKISRMQILAYGTFGLWGPLKCHVCKSLM